MKIVLATVALLAASAASAQFAPTQITGSPPETASLQIAHESANSYYEPSAPGTFDATGGQNAYWRAKMAKFRAAKAEKAAAKATAAAG